MSRRTTARSTTVQLSLFCAALALTTGCLGGPRLESHVGVIGLDELASAQPVANALQSAAILLAADNCVGADCAIEADPYRLGIHDELYVSIWGRPDLGSQGPGAGGPNVAVIDGDGSISLAFLGRVRVVGKTTSEVSSMLQARYTEVVDNPQVDVRLATCRSRSIYLGGEVARPGQAYLCEGTGTLGAMLTQTGGLSANANLAAGRLAREGELYALDYLAAESGASNLQQLKLQDGDSIHFPSMGERAVYVFGEVTRQGLHAVPAHGMNLLDVLARAAGADALDAQTRSIYLARPGTTGAVLYKIDLTDLLLAPEIPIFDGDRVFVPPTKLATWSRWWRQALPFTTAVRTIVRPEPVNVF